MDNNQERCLFTGESAEIKTLDKFDGSSFKSEGCGQYWIDGLTKTTLLSDTPMSILTKLNCASETIKLNEIGIIPFWVFDKRKGENSGIDNIVYKAIEDYQDLPISHSIKSSNILEMMGDKLSKNNPFDWVKFSKIEMFKLKIATELEFLNWLIPLERRGLLEFSEDGITYLAQKNKRHTENFASMLFSKPSVRLTSNGWEKVEQVLSNSKDVFIAMAFTDYEKKLVNKELSGTIKDVCSDLGWNAKVVNEEEHNDGIMDKVLSLINKSKFVIAELTYQKAGVYYEAGYAKGIGLPVIHIVKYEELERCHFDVKHLNLITWSAYSELKEKLKNRIEATIKLSSNK